MPLAAGTRLGPYEIHSQLGQGGWGVVYRAKDVRLNRTVAIKVLAADSAYPEVRQRFEREAQTIAGLNHPHICAIYDVGDHDGISYIVMEYLDGDTLAARIARGPLPLDQAIAHAAQIADALDKAHAQGIVHRDVKPANIMLTRSGVKLLDFGLAKLRPQPTAPTTVSGMPTKADVTAQGTIVGTLQYMAPEQLEGREADARTDIFAFGEVAYEMVTGRRVFEGKSQASLIAAILEHQPAPMSSLQKLTPRSLEQLVHGCLAKNPEERWQSARDVLRQLKDLINGFAEEPRSGSGGSPARERLAWILCAISTVIAILVGARSLMIPPATMPPARPAQRLSVALPKDRPIALTSQYHLGIAERSLAISPDGRMLVYVAEAGGHTQLYLRSLDGFDVKPIAKTEGAFDPFFSPDGRWIGFFTEDKLKKVSTEGGEPAILCDARIPHGGSWSPDGTILFADSEGTHLQRVSADGGPVRTVASMEGSQFPVVLPGGKSAFLTLWTRGGPQVAAVSLDSGELKVLVDGGDAHYLNTGHIVLSEAPRLWPRRLTLGVLRSRDHRKWFSMAFAWKQTAAPNSPYLRLGYWLS